MYKTLLRNADKLTVKKTLFIVKQIKNVDRTYNTITNPITFCELTTDDLSNIIPLEPIKSMTNNIPFFQSVSSVYDNFAVDKDIAETIVTIIMRLNKFHDMDHKQKLLLVVKTYIFLYKLTWIILACLGMPKTHESITNFLDYMNFVLGTITE